MKAVSLFSGCGGMDLGLERAGIQTVLQCEIDPIARSVLTRHWPEVPKIDDVRSLGRVGESAGRSAPDGLQPPDHNGRRETGAGLPSGADSGDAGIASRQRTSGSGLDGPIDLVHGGFPCQDYSVAGNRAGLAGDRGALWWDVIRVLSELRPRWFLGENVAGLLSSSGGRDFATILGSLDELGYVGAWAVCDARYFGVPQRRRRVFLLAGRCVGDDARASAVLALGQGCRGHPSAGGQTRQDVAPTVRTGIARSGEPERGDQALIVSHDVGPTKLAPRGDDGTNAYVLANSVQASAGHHGHSSPRGDGSDNLIPFTNRGTTTGDVSETLISASHGAIPLVGVRRLTPLECERLMGWEDDWTRYDADGRELADSHRYRLCGNGVVAPVATWIGRRLLAVMP